MVTVGYHASHEQAPPSALLRRVRDAEAAGFGAATCSDHFAPWSTRQGHSGHAWAWLGAALQATAGIPIGVVTAPVQRYHPAVAAQAIATLAELYPGRFWAALGSGENLNEHITGEQWPDKPTRDRRLLEAVEVIRALLRGEEVTHAGLVAVDRARLWSLPAEPPDLVGAAVSASTAHTVGSWADGLVTVGRPVDELKPVIDAFRAGGGEGKRVAVKVQLSWARTDDEAMSIAHQQWRTNVFSGELAWNLETTAQFDAAGEHVRPEDVRKHVCVSADLDVHTDWLRELVALGVDELYLHHVGGPDCQGPFIEAFARHVLPALR